MKIQVASMDTLKSLPSSMAQMTLNGVGMGNGYTKSQPIPTHPFDPLSAAEIERAVATVRAEKGTELFFNAVFLQEPRKKDMLAWLDGVNQAPKPKRVADVVAIGRGSKVYDG